MSRIRLACVLLLVATAAASVSAGDAPGATTCAGAAVRAPHAACAEASSGRSVTPSPATARTLPVSACTPVPAQSDPPVCTFGAAPDLATATIALVGDSHAAQWRGALAVVARAKGWHGYSMAHSSCPLQIALA